MIGKGAKSGSGKHASGKKSTDPRLMKKLVRDPNAVEATDGKGKHRRTS